MTTGPTQYDVSSAATQTGIHTHADLAPGALLGGRYRIEAILGIGGMGVVYRASDLTLGVDVALKLLRPELAHRDDVLDRFRQELLLARQVSSPHVVRIHDLAHHDGHWLISMDYVDGESLDHRIDREGPLPLDEALRITEQIAQGLVDAHAKGVVHRDLKPANILLDTQGQAYIADFGVARSLATSGMLQASMTRAGSVVGTPDYLSPEQARGEAADARSDLYAVGLILYEMLAGKLPFSGGTTAEVLAQRMLRAPAPLSRERDVPAWVARLVDRLLRPQPAHRLQGAGEILDAIKHRELPRDMRSLLPQLGRWGAMAVVVAVLLAAGSAWWLGKQDAPPSQVAFAQPLERLLVLPITGDASTEVMAALSAELRDALASRPGLAVVDGERTALAVGQWYLDDRTQVDVAAVQRSIGGQRALHVQLRQQQGHWNADARLHVVGRPVRDMHASAQDPAAALRALLATADFSRALQVGDPPISLAATGALEAYGAGLLARRKGKLAEALAHFTAATAAAPGDAAAWLAQAQAALAIGDVERAADAIEQGQRASNKVPAAVARHLAAQRASIDGDADAAVKQWRAALAATPDDGEAALNLARAQASAGELKPAISGLLELSKRDGNDPRIWYELGKLSILSGQAQRAVDDYLTRALVQYKRARDLYGQAETINALGIGYERLGQSADAAEQFGKAVQLRRTLGNRIGEATSLRNLGNVLAIAGEHDKADRSLREAHAVYAALGNRGGLAAVENDLGLLAEERGNFPQALASFKRALVAWQQIDDPLRIAQAQNDIGFAQFQLGAYNDADVYLRQSADGYAKLGDQTGSIRALQALGLLAIARGQWADARRQLQRTLADAQAAQMHEEAAVSQRHLAELDLWQGHFEAAKTESSRAQASFQARGDARGTADAGLLNAEAQLLSGDIDAAQQALDGMQVSLEQAGAEQRATWQSLRAAVAFAQGRNADAAKILQQARRLAVASGVRQLQLRIELQATRAAANQDAALQALAAPTATLGHVGLRLAWLQRRMQQSLFMRDAPAAVLAYQEASSLLRAGDFRDAATLHSLGAQARSLMGDEAGARAARARMQDAGPSLRARAPEVAPAGANATP